MIVYLCASDDEGFERVSQMSFGGAEYQRKKKRTRREEFLAEMAKVPWDSLLALIEPLYPVAGRGRHPYPIATMLRVNFLQNWFGLSDPAMEEALYDSTRGSAPALRHKKFPRWT
jgi:IS5 family transposase